MKTVWFVLVAVAIVVVRDAQSAAAPATSRLTFTTDRVVIFKDSHGLIVKTGRAKADAQGAAYTLEVPESAVLGSFWALGEGKKVLGMRAEWEDGRELRSTETAAVTMAELLRANAGKRVTLTIGDRRTITGTIAQVLERPEDKGVFPSPVPGFTVESLEGRISPFAAVGPESIRMPGDARELVIKREIVGRGGEFVVIDETETGRLVMPVAQVQSIAGREVVTKIARQEEVFRRSKRLSFDFGKESADKEVSLTLFYFTSGLRWIPTYRITGDLKEKADLALQGEVLNEVEDVSGAALDLVAGVPNFRFKETVSPLTLERQLRQVLLAVSPSYRARGNDLLNSNYSQVAGDMDGGHAAVEGLPALSAELAGAAGEQDLFVYSIKGFSLKKGARGATPLWQANVPLRHVYTMDQPIVRSRAGGIMEMLPGPGEGASPLKIRRNSVWHQLELTNSSSVPWTTGAALTMREHLPVGQDLITYTPSGGRAMVPLTIAVDLLGSVEEEEIARKPGAVRFNQTDYALVRKRGTVTLNSFRKEKSLMRVSLSMGGRAELASDAGKIKLNDWSPTDWHGSSYREVNNHSDVSWELTLEPGEKRRLTYEVSFYVDTHAERSR